MRIGLLIYGDINTLSGGYLYDRRLMTYLREQGDEVVVFSFPHTGFWRRIGDNFRPSFINSLIGADIDVLIADELVHPSLFLSTRRLKRQACCPVVALVHLLAAFDAHPLARSRVHRFMESRLLGSMDGLILNSRTTLEQARALVTGELPPHVIAVPGGDNFPRAAAVATGGGQEGPLKILFVGNVIRRKGLHVLLQALAELPAGDFRLTVAGRLDMEPGYVKAVRRDMEKGSLRETVTVAGPVQGEALAELYRRHDLLVLPSAFEGYGIVYVEAQQFGLPVIGTTAGAAGEIIRQGENGYLIGPGEHRVLAGLLQRLHRDRALLRELENNARHAYGKYPTWADTGAAIRRFLLTMTTQCNDRHDNGAV